MKNPGDFDGRGGQCVVRRGLAGGNTEGGGGGGRFARILRSHGILGGGVVRRNGRDQGHGRDGIRNKGSAGDRGGLRRRVQCSTVQRGTGGGGGAAGRFKGYKHQLGGGGGVGTPHMTAGRQAAACRCRRSLSRGAGVAVDGDGDAPRAARGGDPRCEYTSTSRANKISPTFMLLSQLVPFPTAARPSC